MLDDGFASKSLKRSKQHKCCTCICPETMTKVYGLTEQECYTICWNVGKLTNLFSIFTFSNPANEN